MGHDCTLVITVHIHGAAAPAVLTYVVATAEKVVITHTLARTMPAQAHAARLMTISISTEGLK